MSTHNICFSEEMRKYQHFLVVKSCISGAMFSYDKLLYL